MTELPAGALLTGVIAPASAVGADYTLAAVVHHDGSDVHSGHYWTVARRDGGWWRHDDECVEAHVAAAVIAEAAQRTAYVLIYERIDAPSECCVK